MTETITAQRVRAELDRRNLSVTLGDVGGRWGPSEKWLSFAPQLRIVSFDADAAECARLQRELGSESLRFVAAALGADAGPATLHITEEPACSSLYAPMPDVIAAFPELEVTRLVRTEQVQLTRLDAWCEAEETELDVLKLDVQGAELDVLRGATGILSGVLMMELEVEFNRIYADQPLFADVDAFLRQSGFRLWRLGQLVHYSRGRTSASTVIPDLQAFDSVPVPFQGAGGELFWAHAWYVASDLFAAAPVERRLKAALAATAFGFEDLAEALTAPLGLSG